MSASARKRIEWTARHTFGWAELRPGQAETIESVLEGRDTLAVMPTGFGKSAIYQIAGELLDGLTVIVSPLIALQRDQMVNLQESLDTPGRHRRIHALNSQLTAAEHADLKTALRKGSVDYLFLAPEQLAKPEVLELIRPAGPSLFVIDEAHCVSSWGHDFRPDYLNVGRFIDQLGHPPVLALTATAAPPVRREIAERLHLRDPMVSLAGLNRPNLFLSVRTFTDEDEKRSAVVAEVGELPKPGIVYTATRREAEELADSVRRNGIAARAYHAGLTSGERSSTQDAFLNGELPVVVATTAFGMGIDKPDVRFVVHATIADSLDSYYQEIGRAGRDGEPAQAVLFYRQQDLGIRKFFASTTADEQALTEVHQELRNRPEPATPAHLAQGTDLTPRRVGRALALLEQIGAVHTGQHNAVRAADGRSSSTATKQAVDLAESRRTYEKSRLDMIRDYAESGLCRRFLLLSYFGDSIDEPCGYCDNCRNGHAQPFPPRIAAPAFEVGETLRHQRFGTGTVIRQEGDRLVVLFDENGYRTLSVPALLDQHLVDQVG